MRYRKLIIVAFSSFLYLVAIVLLVYLAPKKKPPITAAKPVVVDTVMVKPIPPRESITFILGEDHNRKNPYYTEAADYYRMNKKDRTEYLVTTCRSLLEVRDYLEKNPPSNHLPWGLINLVAHGSEWLGINVPVIPGSKGATTERLMEYILNDKFKPLPDSLADDSTLIFIHGCGVGKNRRLLAVVAEAFGGKTNKPVARASKLFEFYISSRSNGRPIECQRFLTQSWYFFYPTGYKPSDSIINQKLRHRYPAEKINWKEALKRESPNFAGEMYHYSFEIPIIWMYRFNKKDSIPDLVSDENKIKWLKKQPEIIKITRSFGIPADRFSWWITRISYTNSGGDKLPAVWVKGSCTVLCILKPMVVKKEDREGIWVPFTPSPNDTAYYTSE